MGPNGYLCLSPDQRTLYASGYSGKDAFWAYEVHQSTPFLRHGQPFGDTQHDIKRGARGEDGGTTMCVDTNGWIYVATSQGIQVLDQCGRTNFIIATPKPVRAVCFGGTDLSDLVISCGDNRGSAIYKRPTKARGIVSGQMAPIKPAPPKL
jgi:sugar lactone lactonase YvrE